MDIVSYIFAVGIIRHRQRVRPVKLWNCNSIETEFVLETVYLCVASKAGKSVRFIFQSWKQDRFRLKQASTIMNGLKAGNPASPIEFPHHGGVRVAKANTRISTQVSE